MLVDGTCKVQPLNFFPEMLILVLLLYTGGSESYHNNEEMSFYTKILNQDTNVEAAADRTTLPKISIPLLAPILPKKRMTP